MTDIITPPPTKHKRRPERPNPRNEFHFSCNDKTMRDVLTSALDLANIKWQCELDEDEFYHCTANCSAEEGKDIFYLMRVYMATDDNDKKEKILDAISFF